MSLNSINYFKFGRIVLIAQTPNVLNCSRQDSLKCLCQVIGVRQTRTFFNLTSVGNKKKEYASRKLVGYTMDHVFSVVSDVENYNKFVPFCKKSLVSIKKPDFLKADLVVGFPPINERYTSHVTLRRPHLVQAQCTEGRLFNHFYTVWRFSPGLKAHPQSSVLDFRVEFEFRSMIHSQLATLFFDQVVLQMEDAFLKEVTRRYGKPAIPVKILNPGTTVKS